MQLNDWHEVLFMHGGASTQFMQVPYNLLNADATAAYIDTGIWGAKAIKEAKLFGNVSVIASSKDRNHTYIPTFSVPASSAYLHITTNNTVEGTQWQQFDNWNVPVIADMSSDIFSRKMNFNQFDLIYAGAQKNMGAAGVNLVIVNRNILGKVNRDIPTILDYRNHIKEGSMLNTPPVFAILVSLLTLRWLKKMGGIEAMEKINNKKAELFYTVLDELPLFTGTVERAYRSKMNAVFIIEDVELETAFLEYCNKEGLYGVKGHRSVGGFRVSMYNALPISSVEVMTEAMKYFALKHA
jgi:phosphoserine aminotransferase